MPLRPEARARTPFRVLVADDEPLALEGLLALLARDPDVIVAGAFETGAAALKGVEELQPDVAILDIRMPGITGLELAERVARVRQDVVVVFVTAYDKHAVDAFEASAIDYVLKPFTDDRFFAALERAKSRVRDAVEADHLNRLRSFLVSDALLLRREGAHAGFAERLVVRGSHGMRVVAVEDIDWIEGADYYAKLHVGAKSALIRETLSSLDARLDPARFFRISKSAIVNLNRVAEVRADGRTDFTVVLRDGTKVRLGRGRRGALQAALESGA